MKKIKEIFILYIGIFIDIFAYALLKYSKFFNGEFSFIKTQNLIFKSVELQYSYFIGFLIMLFFYVLGFVYIFIIRFKYKNNIIISLKKSTFFMIVILLFDWVLCLFNIKAMVTSSHAFRFVIICLLTNLVVYIKYKKNNIKIK